jgi:hypothetical protein
LFQGERGKKGGGGGGGVLALLMLLEPGGTCAVHALARALAGISAGVAEAGSGWTA